jgi:hypothetical protein
VVLGLGPVPAEADAQGDPATREVVERGDLLGQHDRIVLGGQQNAGAEPDARWSRAAVASATSGSSPRW